MSEYEDDVLISDGDLEVAHPDKLHSELAKWGRCRGKIKITKSKTTLTESQRKYYFPAVANKIAEKLHEIAMVMDLPPEYAFLSEWLLAETKDTVHAKLKKLFLEELEQDGDEIKERVTPFHRMSKEEFSNYFEHCARWAAMHINLVIEQPTGTESDLNFDR